MEKQQVIKALQRAIASIRRNRSNDAIKDLHILIADLERKIKQDDFDGEYLLDDPN